MRRRRINPEKADAARKYILSEVSLQSVLDDYGISLGDFEYTSNGSVRCRCAFHSEKVPSMYYNFEHNLFQCFSCGRSGGVIKFVKEWENRDCDGPDDPDAIGYREALEVILSKHREMQEALGFQSIYDSVEETYKAVRDEDGNLIFNFNKPHRITEASKTVGLGNVMHKLQAGKDVMILLDFITDCERGMLEKDLIAKYYYGGYERLKSRFNATDTDYDSVSKLLENTIS